jgi:3-hydroxyacyl-[acyl-carrier-protein] dehydratase
MSDGASGVILPRPIDVLPHRDPFLLVSDVVSIDPGVGIVARWHLTGDEYFWSGHFPGRPTLPGVLILESLAQAGAIAVLSDERFATKLPLFGGADGVRFRRQVVPGETLQLEVTLGRMSSRAGKGTGRATVDGKVACDAELLFVLADR